MAKNSPESSPSQVIDYLKDLDKRVTKLENNLPPNPARIQAPVEASQTLARDIKPGLFEIQIGEYWFAYVGIIVLVLAFMFMLSLPWPQLHAAIPVLVGIAVCGGMVFVANRFRAHYKFICLQLYAGAYFLSFVSLLRIFHFSEDTLYATGLLEYTLLTLLGFGLVYHAHQKRSAYLVAFSLTLVMASGVVIDEPFWTLSLNALAALGTVFYSRKLSSPPLFIYGALAVYSAHLLWVLGDPLLTGAVHLAGNPVWHYVFVLIYASILALSIYLPLEGERVQEYVVGNALANGVPAFLLFNFVYLLQPTATPLVPNIIFFLLFMAWSLVFWKRLKINFSMVLFTLLAHGTISIGFIQSVSPPQLYVILIWQSLLVLANAMWFRSGFITVSNFLLYIVLFLAYSTASGFAGIISVSFGFVALLSARLIRAFDKHFSPSYDTLINFYLAIAFFSLPYALWKALPTQWVAFAWLGVTVLYYVMSRVVKSPRYRWMGHLTLLTTLCFVVLQATMGMEALYRILTFFVLGCVLITVSTVYTRIRRGSSHDPVSVSEG